MPSRSKSSGRKSSRPSARKWPTQSNSGAQDDAIEALVALGFTAYEAKVYRALLGSRGPATGYEAARQAGIPTSKVYETLNRLAEKGAILVYESDVNSYAAVPHGDLVARLRKQTEAQLAVAERTLAALPATGSAGLTWTTSGLDNIVDVMQRTAGRAEERILAALWDNELLAIRPALLAAHARGIDVHVAIYGRQSLNIPHSYDLALCGASAEDRLSGRRLSVLVRDGALEAVAAETGVDPSGQTTTAQAIWSENRIFALLCSEYVKEEIMGRCLIDALGETAYARLRKERPELRQMLRRESRPSGK